MSPIVSSTFAMIAIALGVTLLSCSRQNTPPSAIQGDNDIVQTTRVYNAQTALIPDSSLIVVQNLFQKNNMTFSNLQVYRLEKDTLGYYVKCHQFYKGFQLFPENLIIHFDAQGNSNGTYGNRITNLTCDTVPNVTASDAGNVFFSQIMSDSWFKDSVSSFRSAGVNAELGFYDVNLGTGNTQFHFVLAWQLTVASTLKYPVAYIRADTLEMVYYFNGTITN